MKSNRTLPIAALVIAALLCQGGCSSHPEVKTPEIKSLKATDKKKPRTDVELLLCGDLMLDWGVKEVYHKTGPEEQLAGLAAIMGRYDYRFCNLECPISDRGEPLVDKKYIFCARPEQVAVLRITGINGVSLANNHINDFGKIALLDTMSILAKNGIAFTGAGINSAAAHTPVLINIRGIRFAIFAYCPIVSGDEAATRTRAGITGYSYGVIKRDIQKYRKHADFIIISLHWGTEYADYPGGDQVSFAHSLINAGADVIMGHHPHIYQGIEIYKGRPIFYSLGNFIFGSINEDARHNIMAALRFSKKGIKALQIVPITGSKGNHRLRFTPLTGKRAGRLFSHLLEISKPLHSPFSEESFERGGLLQYQFVKEEERDVTDEDI